MNQLTAGLLLLLVVPLLWGLMYWGWRGRRRRFAHLPPPAPVPADGLGAPVLAPTSGTYVSTVTAGDWLDRVVGHGLGVRSPAELTAGERGLLWRREGAPDVFVPAADVLGVRRERGQAGKYTLEEGLVVLTWRLGPTPLDTAFRPRAWADIESVVAALALLAPGDPAAPRAEDGGAAATGAETGDERAASAAGSATGDSTTAPRPPAGETARPGETGPTEEAP